MLSGRSLFLSPLLPGSPENHRVEIKDVSFSYNKDSVKASGACVSYCTEGHHSYGRGFRSGKTTLVSLIPRFLMWTREAFVSAVWM